MGGVEVKRTGGDRSRSPPVVPESESRAARRLRRYAPFSIPRKVMLVKPAAIATSTTRTTSS
jgi:hypothetical protein